MKASDLRKELHLVAQQGDIENLQRFFKTGPGQYGEGDIFIGVRVPVIRKIARKAETTSLPEIKKLLHSKIHEERLLALLIMVLQYKKADEPQQKKLVDLYLANTRYINNWDLVDLSAEYIVGPYLLHRERNILYELAESDLLWDRRIAIIATYDFIRHNDFADTLGLTRVLLHDHHDLIHKAVGWMLREVGNRSRTTEEKFLRRYYQQMPRTMLRYAIEKFPEDLRQDYLKGRI